MIRHFDIASPAASPKGIPAKRETSETCRERAAADLLESAAMINAQQRLRMETSAAVWTERAEMLQRVEDSIIRRTAVTVAARSLAGDEPAERPPRL